MLKFMKMEATDSKTIDVHMRHRFKEDSFVIVESTKLTSRQAIELLKIYANIDMREPMLTSIMSVCKDNPFVRYMVYDTVTGDLFLLDTNHVMHEDNDIDALYDKLKDEVAILGGKTLRVKKDDVLSIVYDSRIPSPPVVFTSTNKKDADESCVSLMYTLFGEHAEGRLANLLELAYDDVPASDVKHFDIDIDKYIKANRLAIYTVEKTRCTPRTWKII